MSIRALERIAIFSLVLGLISLAAAIGLLWSPGGAAPAADVSAARATLTKAQVLRSESAAADDRFDTLVEGLVAGVGFDTPDEIAADLDHVQTARVLEKTLGRRTEATERSIAQALGRANATLTRIGASRPLVDVSSGGSRALAAAAALVAAAFLLTAGTGLALRVLAVRRAELLRIAERLRIPAAHVNDGSLGEEVTIYALKRTTVQESVAAVLTPSPVRVAAAPEPLASEAPPPAMRVEPRRPADAERRPAAPAVAPPPAPEPGSGGPFLFDIKPLSKGTDD